MGVLEQMSFADRLREHRRERGWRQVDLAKAIGVNKDTIRNWETGRTDPDLSALGLKAVAFVKALGSSEGALEVV